MRTLSWGTWDAWLQGAQHQNLSTIWVSQEKLTTNGMAGRALISSPLVLAPMVIGFHPYLGATNPHKSWLQDFDHCRCKCCRLCLWSNLFVHLSPTSRTYWDYCQNMNSFFLPLRPALSPGNLPRGRGRCHSLPDLSHQICWHKKVLRIRDEGLRIWRLGLCNTASNQMKTPSFYCHYVECIWVQDMSRHPLDLNLQMCPTGEIESLPAFFSSSVGNGWR